MVGKNVYSVKSICVDAVISCVLAGVSFICQFTAFIISYVNSGRGPKAVGLLGIAALLFAVTGMVFCRSAWKSPDGGIFMKRISGAANAVMILITVLFFIVGLKG
ncbi:MAG: hypothetical protein E7271_11675 [Lachnospiraceae bacterium]|jgi:hypothetical protein|nr:hypothetical protein [Lachnospiraceae bacterium]